MEISFDAAAARADVIIAPVHKDLVLPKPTEELNAASEGQLAAALKVARAKGSVGDKVEVLAPRGVEAGRVILIGVDQDDEVNPLGLERAVGAAVRSVLSSGAEIVRLRLDGLDLRPETLAHAALGARLATYRFDRYRTKLKVEQRPSLARLDIQVDAPDQAGAAWTELEAVADGVNFARELVNEPPNVLHPEEFARRCQEMTSLGLEVEVLGEAEMTKLGMNSLLAVGLGSERESKLVVMRWKGAGRADPVLFVGKGVTFDTGGISIKPGASMEDMKGDMGGAAAVTGVMRALATRGANANVVGVIGLVENMPDGRSFRPGDILTSMSGQTIEVQNTDAEGRLVLADALWYGIDRFKPRAVVDLATLTGAMVISLGQEHAGLFSNDDKLAGALSEAGGAVDEPVWRMPLGKAYDKLIDSTFADMKNIGGRYGGSITAAQFLQRFVGDAVWAHLDIAPTAWRAKADDPRQPSWGTGWGVRLLDRFVRKTIET